MFMGSSPASAGELGKVDFSRDIRPILSDKCFTCHGPDAAKRKGKLRLDDQASAFGNQTKSKKPAIVPGKPEASQLIARIFSTDDDEVMPPRDSHKQLTEAQKQKLKDWIASGAKWDMHWAFVTPRKPAPPDVQNRGWGHNEIDAFVLARLEKLGLKPSPEADRRISPAA
jgi:hypothetical protein